MSDDLSVVRSFYGANVQSVGPSFSALGWYTPETQRLRFEVFQLLGDFDGTQVLDCGCGLGDFFRFLLEKKYAGVHYSGLDVMPEFIAEARKRFQDHGNAEFYSQGWMDWQTPVDWVLCSGALNLKQLDPYQYVETQLKKFLSLARKGVAVNFLSRHGEPQDPDQLFYYYDPNKILEIAFKVTPHVALHHDYLPNDFTLFLYPG